jgi:hypothetical protein
MNFSSSALLRLPPARIATPYAIFHRAARRWGPGRGYLLGLFQDVPNRWGDPAWLGFICLVLPVIGGYTAFFPAARRGVTRPIILASLAHALINGVLEEILWRGV